MRKSFFLVWISVLILFSCKQFSTKQASTSMKDGVDAVFGSGGTDTFKVGDNILTMLADAQVIKTKNANDEVRYKLSISPTTDYASETSMADVFGVELSAGDFNVAEFQKQFQTRESVAVGSGVGA